MNELYRFHHDLAYLTIVLNLGAGIWMLLSLKFVDFKRTKYFFVPVYAGWASLVIQVFLGVSLYMTGEEVASTKGFHYFYGFLLFAVATIMWSYRNSLPANKKVLIYGLSSIFMGAMGLRAALLVLL